jgi:hypothetical protein
MKKRVVFTAPLISGQLMKNGLFGDCKEMRLTELRDEERIKRWKENWFWGV